MAWVLTGCQQVYGLYHVGMAADDGIDSQVTQSLGHGGLVCVGRQPILRAPVDEENGGICTGGLHLLDIGAQFPIEFRQMVIGEVVEKALLRQLIHKVEHRFAALVEAVGIGVADHTEVDAVYIDDGPFLLVGSQVGAQGFQALFPDYLHGPLEAYQPCIQAVVVGGEKHLEARILGGIHNGVGTVELWVPGVGVAVVCACQGGFQVGNGVVCLLDNGGDVAENGGEIVAPVLLLPGIDDLLVHQQISRGKDRGGGDGCFRIRGLRLGGLILDFCGLCGGDACFLAGDPETGGNDQNVRNSQNCDQYG